MTDYQKQMLIGIAAIIFMLIITSMGLWGCSGKAITVFGQPL